MDLVKAFSTDQYRSALEEWQWIGLEGKSPIASSTFGDTFLESDDGYWFLDVIAGTLERVWPDKDALDAVLASEDGQDRWLLRGLAVAAADARITLGSAEVYDFTRPPVLGGAFEVTNLSAMDFVVAVDIAGQLHQQIHGLAPGTKVSGFALTEVPNRAGKSAAPRSKRGWRRR